MVDQVLWSGAEANDRFAPGHLFKTSAGFHRIGYPGCVRVIHHFQEISGPQVLERLEREWQTVRGTKVRRSRYVEV